MCQQNLGIRYIRKMISVFFVFLLIVGVFSGCSVEHSGEQTVPENFESIDIIPQDTTNVPQDFQNTAPINTEPKRFLYDFTAMVSSGRELNVVLVLEEPADSYTTAVTEILVYDGDMLLQTITKDDVRDVMDYAWDGLFVNKGSTIGEPDIRDLNFDGSDDFGLLAVEIYPQHVPYSYFIWDEETDLFVYQFTAFGVDALQVDDEEMCLVETSYEGFIPYKKVFTFELDGTVVSNFITEED